jgi:hypothetical protein
VADDSDVVSGCSSKCTTITNFLLDVADNGTFGDLSEWEDVSNSQVGVLSSIDELSSVHALVAIQLLAPTAYYSVNIVNVRNEGLGVRLEVVWVTECNSGERSTTTGIVDDILHQSANVSMAFGVIEVAELCWGLAEAVVNISLECSLVDGVKVRICVPVVGCEDRAATLSLVANYSTLVSVSMSKYIQRIFLTILTSCWLSRGWSVVDNQRVSAGVAIFGDSKWEGH